MKYIHLLAFLLITLSCSAQFSLTGKIIAETPGINGVTVTLEPGNATTVSEKEIFQFKQLKKGNYKLLISGISIADKTVYFQLSSDTMLSITVESLAHLKDEVVVTSTRAATQTPVTFSTIDKTEIKKINSGKDIPYLLGNLPSVITTSDAGNGIGYTGLRIRGSDASRINVTINGVPVNDAESQNVYWVDLPDLASSVENIQVQRGVGTSTNGAGSFGGSVNILTKNWSNEPYAVADISAGSYHTLKNTLSIGSGLLHKHWFAETRLSKISSDGYIDRASSNLQSFFASAGYADAKTILKLNIIGGKEITYQSWNGVPEAKLKNDLTGIYNFISNNFSNDEESANLLNSGRTYNYYTYADQVDNYKQDYYQLLLSRQLNIRLLFSAALHYTYGKGYYEEFKYAGDYSGNGLLSTYGLPDIYIGNDTITSSDVVRRKWLSNDFYGATWSLDYFINSSQKLIIAGAANEYDGRHFDELTWMQYAASIPPFYRYNNDNARKKDINIFAKYSFQLFKNFNIYIDYQIRTVNYNYNGLANSESDITPLHEQLNFQNPKGGIFYSINKNQSAYISAAIAHKEPDRDDYKESTPSSRPLPEMLTDYESGYTFKNSFITATANYYYMYYHNQLVLTGAVNDVGNYTRTNVPSSYRKGIELSADFKLPKFISGGATFTLSSSKIKSFDEFISDYDNSTQIHNIYKNTDIAFSPSASGSAYLNIEPVKNIRITLTGRYVGKQYLDNTTDEKRMLDAYNVLDAGLTWTLFSSIAKEINLSLYGYNILNKEYSSNGYTYGYIYYGNTVRENMFYPQAGTNFLARASVDF
jgi:iron complex outermembrane receptor protein